LLLAEALAKKNDLLLCNTKICRVARGKDSNLHRTYPAAEDFSEPETGLASALAGVAASF
jgi:hypothetical protein